MAGERKSGTHESVRVYFILERDSEKPSAVGSSQSCSTVQESSCQWHGGTIRARRV
ncbi:hypothetical protein J3F84DRAFT_391426 [Trichoderma pleuroticola]